jgi:hypothetical protein
MHVFASAEVAAGCASGKCVTGRNVACGTAAPATVHVTP